MSYCQQCGYLCEITKNFKLITEQKAGALANKPENSEDSSNDSSDEQEHIGDDGAALKKQHGGAIDSDSDSSDEEEEESDAEEEAKPVTKKTIKADYADLIKKIINDELDNEDFLISDYNEKDLSKHPDFKKLSSKQRDHVMSAIQHFLPDSEKKWKGKSSDADTSTQVYYVCINCKNFETMKAGTMIHRKYFGTHSKKYDIDRFRECADEAILPRTRNYTCPNKNCKSHTDKSVAEKVIKRPDGYKIVNVCCACGEVWV
jgi:hypothetical protein